MRFSSLTLALVPTLLTVAAEQLDIPQVDAVVQKVLHDYYNYTHYTPPPGTSNSTSKNSPKVPAAGGQPYWYEQIAHQGISAFGPSGYAVYRNVKDYGAKGTLLFALRPRTKSLVRTHETQWNISSLLCLVKHRFRIFCLWMSEALQDT